MRLRQRLLETTKRQRAVAVATALATIALLAWFVAMERSGSPDGAAKVAPAFASTRSVPMDPASSMPAAGPLPSTSTTRPADVMTACLKQTEALGIRPGAQESAVLATTTELLERTRRQAFAAMLQSGELRSQAGVLYLLAFGAKSAKLRRASGCEANDDECRQQADNDQAMGEGTAEALARQASRGSDPVVYGWAYRTCKTGPADDAPSCASISAAQWARLSPGNATPWLAAAREAADAKNRVAEDEAMFQVASADRVEGDFFVLPGLLAAQASNNDDNPFGAFLLSAEAIGRVGSDRIETLQAVSSYCNVAGLVDANRREVCDRVVTLLTQRSSTLLELSIGKGLGARLGWSEARMKAIQEEQDALHAASLRVGEVPADPVCTDTVRHLAFVSSAAVLGEVGALRQAVAASGKSVASLAADYNRMTKKLNEQWAAAQAAASAASTPYSAALPPSR